MKSENYRAAKEAPAGSFPITNSDFDTLGYFSFAIHAANVQAGWWTDIRVGELTGEALDRNFGELIALAHSELSEAMEGHRKNKMDDHLPQYPMWWVELADTFIRIMDMAGAGGVPFGEVVEAKLAYNAQRKDHKIEARQAADGKKY